MSAIKGQYRNGQVILDQAADWPDGIEVTVEPVSVKGATRQPEVDDTAGPEAIARWIAEFEAIPPLELSPEEEAAWNQARQKQRERELARWEDNARQVEGLFP